MFDVEYEVKIKDKNLVDKIDKLLDDNTNLQIHDLFAKILDPYVPMLEGPLSQTVEVHPAYIKYIQPYAHYQYHGTNFNHTLDYHPLATAEWDKVAMQTEIERFENDVKQILIRRVKELYG